MNSLNLTMRLQNIHCFKTGEERIAEPYLWAVFFKLDGDTVVINENLMLEGTATIFGTHGFQSNLFGRSAGAGDNLPVPPPIGEYRTTLRPIPLINPLHLGSLSVSEVAAVCGCLVILMEEDNTPNSAVEAGYQQLVTSLRDALNALIPTLRMMASNGCIRSFPITTAICAVTSGMAVSGNGLTRVFPPMAYRWSQLPRL